MTVALRNILLMIVGFVLLISGCRTREDISARYELERKLWKAQVLERKINIAFVKASQLDLKEAIREFENVVGYEPLKIYDTKDWDEDVVKDIRRIGIVSKIAMANLYFLNEKYYVAGDFYTLALDETGLDFQKRLDIRLNVVKTMYLAGESDMLENNCALIFEDIVRSEVFWSGGFELNDIFLSIPLMMVKIYRESDNDEQYVEFGKVAENFYTRIASTWPDGHLAERAIQSRVSLKLLQEKWLDALSDIDQLLNRSAERGRRENLLLLKGEILAYALERPVEAGKIFDELIEKNAGTVQAYAAMYNTAVLELEKGNLESAHKILREVENGAGVPHEIVSKALLTRALQLEDDLRWDEALPLLRRIMSLYSETSSAIEAPLVITRHYIAVGERKMAEKSLESATEFYIELIVKASDYQGNRLMVEDFLIENYMAMGKAEEVAAIMEEQSVDWDEVSSVGGMFRSAVIYSEFLKDDEKALRVLKKSIELFPETRYAKMARKQLEKLEQRAQGD